MNSDKVIQRNPNWVNEYTQNSMKTEIKIFEEKLKEIEAITAKYKVDFVSIENSFEEYVKLLIDDYFGKKEVARRINVNKTYSLSKDPVEGTQIIRFTVEMAKGDYDISGEAVIDEKIGSVDIIYFSTSSFSYTGDNCFDVVSERLEANLKTLSFVKSNKFAEACLNKIKTLKETREQFNIETCDLTVDKVKDIIKEKKEILKKASLSIKEGDVLWVIKTKFSKDYVKCKVVGGTKKVVKLERIYPDKQPQNPWIVEKYITDISDFWPEDAFKNYVARNRSMYWKYSKELGLPDDFVEQKDLV